MKWEVVDGWKHEVADTLAERGEVDIAEDVRKMNRYLAFGLMVGWPHAGLAAEMFVEMGSKILRNHEADPE